MSTTKPSNVQLHIADANKELIFVHPETTFNQVIDNESGKSLQDFLTERDSQRVNFTRAFYPLTVTTDGQTEFMFNDDKFDPAHATVVVHVNGEFMHPVEEYTVIKETGLLPKLVLVEGVKVNDWIHVTVQRGITSKAPVIVPKYPPFSDGYVPTGKKYGVSINKNEASTFNRVQYIEDAIGMVPAKMNYTAGTFDYGSWGDIWFIKNNYPVMLNPDGTEAYKLDPNNYGNKADGTLSEIDSTTHSMNVMSRIPKVFIRQWEDDTHEYILVSDIQHDETWNAFAHTDDKGDIKDSLYLSAFKATNPTGTKLRSLYGKAISNRLTLNLERDYSIANGTGWNIRSWSQRNLINSLLTIISKSTDGQLIFGNGLVGATASRLNTGTLYTKGQFFGSNNENTQIKVFHIEGWWGEYYERINGLICNMGSIMVRMTGPYSSGFDSTPIKYTATFNEYPKTMMMSDYGYLPLAGTGSSLTYVPDQVTIYTNDIYVAVVGNSLGSGLQSGPYSLRLFEQATVSASSMAVGLSYI